MRRAMGLARRDAEASNAAARQMLDNRVRHAAVGIVPAAIAPRRPERARLQQRHFDIEPQLLSGDRLQIVLHGPIMAREQTKNNDSPRNAAPERADAALSPHRSRGAHRKTRLSRRRPAGKRGRKTPVPSRRRPIGRRVVRRSAWTSIGALTCRFAQVTWGCTLAPEISQVRQGCIGDGQDLYSFVEFNRRTRQDVRRMPGCGGEPARSRSAARRGNGPRSPRNAAAAGPCRIYRGDR